MSLSESGLGPQEAHVVMEYIQCEMKGEVGLLTIDRPESLNALNSQVVRELDEALHELEAKGEVKAVVLTGAGDKAFVAGGDIKEMLTLDVSAARTFSRNGQQMVLYIETMTKPVLAAVNGYALGGGLELALACDFIYASESARFGLPEVTLGVSARFRRHSKPGPHDRTCPRQGADLHRPDHHCSRGLRMGYC